MANSSFEAFENKKINKLIWQYALPSMIGTAVNGIYNIIDRIFIGRGVGDIAVGAIGIVFPVMMIMTAFGMLVARGAGNRVSIYLGKKDYEMADKIAGCSILLSFIISAIVIACMLFFLSPLLRWLKITPETFGYAREFLLFYLPGSIFLCLCWCLNNMMRASGYPKKSMITMMLGVIVNLIAAPLFIFGFKMGIRGAALATVLSMFSGFCYVLIHFLRSKSNLRLHKRHLRLRGHVMKDILSIGISPFCIQIISATISFVIIKQLERYGGDIVIQAFTIVSTLLFVIFMLLTGLTQGVQPIMGYNYGAKNYQRVKEAVIYTMRVGFIIGCVGLIIGMAIPKYFAMLFSQSPALLTESVKAMRIVCIFLPLVGFQITITNFFLSIGSSIKSIILSLSRQFIFFIPALYILGHFFQLKGIWISMPVADLLSFLVALLFFILQLKELTNKAADQKPV